MDMNSKQKLISRKIFNNFFIFSLLSAMEISSEKQISHFVEVKMFWSMKTHYDELNLIISGSDEN